MSNYIDMFPIYLRRLDECKTVLVGGNHEAQGKAKQLLERNANLTVISSHLTEKMQKWVGKNRFKWISRTYKQGDLEGAFMAIVAEYKRDVNKKVYQEAKERGILVNVMDDLPHANFAFGSIIKQGPLTISISTSGAAPALSVRLRQRFENEFGPEYGDFLEFMQKLRKPMSYYHDKFEIRKQLWYEVIDSDVLTLFREDKPEEAHQKTADIVGEQVVVDALKTQKSRA